MHSKPLESIAPYIRSDAYFMQATTFLQPGDAISSMQNWRIKGRRLRVWSKSIKEVPGAENVAQDERVSGMGLCLFCT